MKLIILCVLSLLTLTLGLGAFYIWSEFQRLESDDPLVWESAIQEFEKSDLEGAPPKGAVLFVGSSSIRFWKTLEKDMVPLSVINRGFGGAKLRDVIHYFDRIILPYAPQAIVLFAGTNDITGRPNDKRPDQILSDFRELIQKIQRQLPHSPVYYIPITPTSSRWEIWPQAEKANQLIRAFIDTKEGVHLVDTTPHFINHQGKVKKNLLWWDGIHLNKKGYQVWRDMIRDRLMKDLD